MNTLFTLHVEQADIPPILGLSYTREYITVEQEAKLTQQIDALPWDNTWERRRQLYGASYGAKATAPEGEQPPIPPWGLELAERLQEDGIGPGPFDQMLINEYAPGQGIALHSDYRPFDRTVVSLSLLSPCVMDFEHAGDGRKHSLLLERRSLLVLRDEARYDWKHGIARRKKDRWKGIPFERDRRLSVTFRRRVVS
jgi:hypothetical protein